jgi:60 kDa SS-A/Ro ribonucleoprotein
MAKNYAKHVSAKNTPQTEPILGANQTRNNAGGYSFTVSKWDHLARFLVLGSAGGTYYVGERKLTRDAAACVLECAAEDFDRTLSMVCDYNISGRVPKVDPSLFALAILASLPDGKGAAALQRVNDMCRIGTHLFQFTSMLSELRGRGRSVQRAYRDWYLSKSGRDLAYQVTKYANRESWTHRDVLRLAKPKTDSQSHDIVFAYVTGKDWRAKVPSTIDDADTQATVDYLNAVETVKTAQRASDAVPLIQAFGLPREVLPTQLLNDKAVWQAMLPSMPLHALVRNLGKLSTADIGLTGKFNPEVQTMVDKITDGELIKRSRLHPMSILVALRTYALGRGLRGGLSWSPDPHIMKALDDAFYKSFEAVTPTGKRHLVALDVSGSMGSLIAGTPLDCMTAGMALAMVAMRTEPQTYVTAFSSGSGGWSNGTRASWGSGSGIQSLPLTKSASLTEATALTRTVPWGGTDCSLPMLYAKANKIPVDVFMVITDSETWAGNVHPHVALQDYRKAMNIPAKLVVVGMTATDVTIADPNDGGMLDVVGFDTSCPQVIADFCRS